MTKSNKIITTLLLAFVMCVSIAFGNMFTAKVNAASEVKATDILIFSAGVTDKKMQSDAVVATVKNGENIAIKNKLVISDLELEFDIPEGFIVNVVVTADSYYVNGNKAVDAEGKVSFDKQIENKIAVTGTADKEVLTIGVDNKFFITANGGEISNDTTVKGKDYYKLANVMGNSIGDVAFEFQASEGVTGQFKLISVNQKASDKTTDAFKQTFKITSSGELETIANPRVIVDSSFYTQIAKGQYVAKRIVSTGGNYETISATLCSVVPVPSTVSANPTYLKDSDVFITAKNVKGTAGVADEDAQVALESGTATPKKIAFIKEGITKISLSVKVKGKKVECEELTINVFSADKTNDDSAPYYVNDKNAIEAFKAALEKEYRKEGKDTFVPLGSTLEIPSMEDFIFDDFTPYDKLTYTTYYKARTEGTSSKLEFKLNEAGEYIFYVAFGDQSGNTMTAEDFITVNEENKEVEYGQYADEDKVGNFVFTFAIADDAEIVITKPMLQGTAFKGVKFIASKFTIDADGCKLEYKLYYNANPSATEDSEGWVEIPKESLVKDKEYSKDGFTYDMIKSIGYDGKLTFTPHEEGTYMIECTATSDVSPRTASAKTIIKSKIPTTVTPDDKWLENNVWSLVFLGLGVLCLAGVIVLLRVKPKEETDEDNN